MEDRTIGVQGCLIKWARNQQGITMRWIADHGGPSLGYQSEVEHGKKCEVRSELLSAWGRLLHVTEPFLRGQVPRYDDRPEACYGRAGTIAAAVAERRPDLPDWPAMDPLERAREVLRLTTQRSPQLPRVVLAYVLGLELVTLDQLLMGEMPLTKELVEKLASLTALPLQFFKTGELSLEDDYVAAIREAKAAGLSPHDLCRLIAQQTADGGRIGRASARPRFNLHTSS